MEKFSRRTIGLGVLSSLFFSVFPAFASEKPLIPCRYLGQKVVFRERIFTCVAVKVKGKRTLAWDSGKPLPSPREPITPTPSPTQSPQPTITPGRTISKIEIPLGKSSEVPPNGSKIFTAKNRYGNLSGYVVIRSATSLIALSDICPHKGCNVEIKKEGLLCPCHNALFDPANGEVLRGPASYPLERIPVREIDEVIYVTD